MINFRKPQGCDTERISTNDQQNQSANEGVADQKQPHQQTSALPAAGQCRQIKSDGSHCGANARRGSVYCFFHDPDSAKERVAARINGGKKRSRKAAVLPADTPNTVLTSAADVTALLAETINQVRRGEVAAQVSNAVGYLAGILLKAKQQDQLEQRVARVESILASKWANPNSAVAPMPEPQSFEFVNPRPSGPA